MSAAGVAERAVAYIRIPEGVLAGEACEREHVAPRRDAIARWAEARRVEIAAWHVDMGVSGVTPIAERPGLVAAYRDLVAQRASALVAASADQFSRDELVARLIDQAARMMHAALETADGSTAESASREPAPLPDAGWSRGAIALARAHERVTMRARVRAALADRRARGLRAGTLPYGSRLATDGLHTEPDPGEQAIIAEVLRLTREGRSQRAVASVLAARGVTGRTGAPLGQTQIANILRRARAST